MAGADAAAGSGTADGEPARHDAVLAGRCAQPIGRDAGGTDYRGLAFGGADRAGSGNVANKDAAPVLEKLGGMADLIVAVPVPDHACHSPENLVEQAHMLGLTAMAAGDPAQALTMIADRLGAPAHVLIAGSLYLAGQVLAANDEAPC